MIKLANRVKNFLQKHFVKHEVHWVPSTTIICLNSDGRKILQITKTFADASFFARMNCPELTLGFYTREEVIDGDFKEYPMEEMRQSVEDEIKANANTEDFVEEVSEQEKATSATDIVEEEVPEFMKG